jgi:hypothetical protein
MIAQEACKSGGSGATIVALDEHRSQSFILGVLTPPGQQGSAYTQRRYGILVATLKGSTR